MARYYEGVNGSMQGTAGGVNVYNWRGLWLQRARRKSALSFVPTAKQRVVINNFTTMSKALTLYAPAFKYGFPKTGAGMTARAQATKVNFARQMQSASGGVIEFDPSRVIVSDGMLGLFDVNLSEGRDYAISLTWTKPALTDPLYGAQLCFLAVNETKRESILFTFDSSAESANISVASLARGDGRFFIFARTLEGASVQQEHDYTWD